MFMDTSIIIELLTEKNSSSIVQSIMGLITNEELFISLIQLGELSDWCLKNDVDPDHLIPKIKTMVNILPLNEQIILKGSQLKWKRRSEGISKFGLMDGIILASAIELNETLLTLDSDFKDLDNVIVLTD